MNALQTILGDVLRALDGVDKTQLSLFAVEIQKAPRVFVGGAGRSGLVMRAFAMRLMHLGLKVFVIGEVVTPGIENGDLLLIGTGSGTTKTLVTHVSQAKAFGARVGAITIQKHSPIAAAADFQINISAPSPKIDGASTNISVQPMGSLFEQALLLITDAVILILMETIGQESKEMFARHANLE